MQKEQTIENENPRNQYISKLIIICDRVHSLIYFDQATAYQSLDGLEGIIDFLDYESQKKLKAVSEQINLYQESNKNLSGDAQELKNLYKQIMSYLHTTFLQDIAHLAKPKYQKKGHLSIKK